MKLNHCIIRLSGIFKICCLLTIIFIVSACNDQQDVIDADNTQSLKISAQLSQTAISRSYQEKGPVEGGTFYLTYPDKNNANVLAYVNFGVEGTNPAIGIVKLPSNNNNYCYPIKVPNNKFRGLNC